jgi:hypothetical protein
VEAVGVYATPIGWIAAACVVIYHCSWVWSPEVVHLRAKLQSGSPCPERHNLPMKGRAQSFYFAVQQLSVQGAIDNKSLV